MSHVVSILVLILRLRSSKSAVGISLKTQELFLLVFVTRYLDLFNTFYSLYNSIMKIAYISATASIIYMIRFKEPYKSKYDRSQDSFLHVKFAVAPCAVLALISCLMKRELYPVDVLWTFSIYLEALAIVPQLFVLQRYREVENLTGHYVFFLVPIASFTSSIGSIALTTNRFTVIIGLCIFLVPSKLLCMWTSSTTMLFPSIMEAS